MDKSVLNEQLIAALKNFKFLTYILQNLEIEVARYGTDFPVTEFKEELEKTKVDMIMLIQNSNSNIETEYKRVLADLTILSYIPINLSALATRITLPEEKQVIQCIALKAQQEFDKIIMILHLSNYSQQEYKALESSTKKKIKVFKKRKSDY